MPPPIPDFSQLGALPTAPAPAIPLPPTQQPAILGDILAPEPTLPDVSNAVPAPNTAYAFDMPVEPAAPQAPVAPEVPQAPQAPVVPQVPPVPPQTPPTPQNGPADPGQFQIPGQQ